MLGWRYSHLTAQAETIGKDKFVIAKQTHLEHYKYLNCPDGSFECKLIGTTNLEGSEVIGLMKTDGNQIVTIEKHNRLKFFRY